MGLKKKVVSTLLVVSRRRESSCTMNADCAHTGPRATRGAGVEAVIGRKSTATKRKEREIGTELAHEPLAEQSHLYRRNVTICICVNLVEEREKRRHDELAGN